MEPFTNENETPSSLQRVLIGLATLIVVILTVIAAIFLAMQELPGGEATPLAQISPSPTITNTPSPVIPTSTPTLVPPTDTPTATALPPVATTPIPPPATDTPLPSPPTFTPTPVVIVITATPLPATSQPDIGPESACPPPPGWVAYTVQSIDSLNSLAVRTSTSVFNLQQANCLASSSIQPGQVLYLPFTPPPPPDTPVPSPTGTRAPTPTRTPTAVVPVINDVIPDNVDEETNKEAVIITVIGRNFRSGEAGFKVELRGPKSLELQLGAARSDTSFDAIVPPNLPLGTYDLVVTNPNNRAGSKEPAFTIGQAIATSTPPTTSPRIISVSPQMGQVSDEIILIVDGTDFRPNEDGFKVELVLGSTVIELTEFVGTSTDRTFQVRIPPDTLSPGEYDLVVTNPDGRSDTEENAYEAKE